MARYCRVRGEQVIESFSIFWRRDEDSGKYLTEVRGVRYELEKKVRNLNDGVRDTGWYLYSIGVPAGFIGEFCGRRILGATSEAARMISDSGLHKERSETDTETETEM